MVTSLKGVDVTTSSLTFKTPTTRGFNGSGNTRFNQLVDGMDNQAPGLNFSVASIIGLSELDVDNIELLSGASSALYGAGGMNGTLLINSKNPFKYQGLSVLVKEGIMHVGANSQRAASPYHNWTMRWAGGGAQRRSSGGSTQCLAAEGGLYGAALFAGSRSAGARPWHRWLVGASTRQAPACGLHRAVFRSSSRQRRRPCALRTPGFYRV